MNLMDLFVKISLKDEASEPLKRITGAVGKGLATGAKVGIAAVGAASAAIGGLVAQSVRAYARYEQLVGGVETLFSNLDGTVSAAPKVLENAAKAYETAGISASQYMDVVTSFSAALVSSLNGDYEEAARIADQTIIDMADNANKMGTSMESIQAAYAGFAKQNYTMLDNLKLGYGGTKSEMERLLKDAQKITGVKYNINNLEDVYEAIHVIQVEMGIAGATAEEANKTIEGSFDSLKAAWQNLITGLGDPNADLGALFDNVVERAEIALNNLLPVVRRALSGVVQLVGKIAPTLAKELPSLLSSLLPELISAATELVRGLAEALPEILGVLIENAPALIEAGFQIASTLIQGIVEALPELLNKVWETVDTAISNSGFAERWTSIRDAISDAVEKIKEKWESLKEKLQPLIDKVGEAWQKFKDWEEEHHVLETAIGLVGDAIGLVVDAVGFLVDAFNTVLEVAGDVASDIIALWEPVKNFFSGLADIISSIVGESALPGMIEGTTGWVLNRARGGRSGKFAGGNDYVPYDNYPAMLHRGEAVLTAREADEWRRGEGSGRQVVNNFTFNGVSQSDLDMIVAYVNRGVVMG